MWQPERPATRVLGLRPDRSLMVRPPLHTAARRLHRAQPAAWPGSPRVGRDPRACASQWPTARCLCFALNARSALGSRSAHGPSADMTVESPRDITAAALAAVQIPPRYQLIGDSSRRSGGTACSAHQSSMQLALAISAPGPAVRSVQPACCPCTCSHLHTATRSNTQLPERV